MTPPQIQLGPRSQSSYIPSQEFTFTPSEESNRILHLILHLKASNWKVFKYSGRAEGWDFGRCSGHQAPKAYGNPKRTWAPASPRLQKSHPWLHCFSQTQNTQKQWPRSDTQGSASPAKLNAGPIHSSQEQQESRALILGPPGTPLHMGQVHIGVTQAWFHGCIQYCLKEPTISKGVDSSLAYLEQTSANHSTAEAVNTRENMSRFIVD